MIHVWTGWGGIREGEKVVINLIRSFMKNANAGINLGFLSSPLANGVAPARCLWKPETQQVVHSPTVKPYSKSFRGVRCCAG